MPELGFGACWEPPGYSGSSLATSGGKLELIIVLWDIIFSIRGPREHLSRRTERLPGCIASICSACIRFLETPFISNMIALHMYRKSIFVSILDPSSWGLLPHGYQHQIAARPAPRLPDRVLQMSIKHAPPLPAELPCVH